MELISSNFINFKYIGGYSSNNTLYNLFDIGYEKTSLTINAIGTVNFVNISGIKGSVTGSPGCTIVDFRQKDSKFFILSQNGVNVNRPGNQPDY